MKVNFTQLDQKAYTADYKKTYYIPELETALSNVKNNPSKWNAKKLNNPVNQFAELVAYGD